MQLGIMKPLTVRMDSKRTKRRESLYTTAVILGVLATGGGSCLSASDEGGRDLPQTGGIGAELRDKLLNGRLINTRPEGFTALKR